MTKKQVDKMLKSVRSTLTDIGWLSDSQIEHVINRISEETPTNSWWIILLKVLAYLIGLLLAGYGTAQAATMVLPFNF